MSLRARLARLLGERSDSATSDAASAGAAIAIGAEVRALLADGRLGAALARAQRALDCAPDDGDLLHLRGEALAAWGRDREAVRSLERAVELGARDPAAHRTLGAVLLRLGRTAEAEREMRLAAAAAPADLGARLGIAEALLACRRPDEAGAVCAEILAADPRDAAALSLLAHCRLEAGDAPGAEALLRRAIDVDPRDAKPRVGLGVALVRQARPAEALAAFGAAMDLPARGGAQSEAWRRHAACLHEGGRLAEAIAIYERNLARHPSAEARAEYAVLLLSAGRLAEAWPHYEFRWMTEGFRASRVDFGRPVWDGQDVAGRTVLLCAEQGLGDTFQFVRYAPWLKARGATVLLIPYRGLGAIADDFPGIDRVLRAGEPLPDFDYFVPLMSLPRIFGTDLDCVPSAVPYLRPRPALAEAWSKRIGRDGPLRVGLAWAGHPGHRRDRLRSVPAEMLNGWARLAGVKLFSLQKAGAGAAPLPLPSGLPIVDLGPDLHDFADTAAAIANLDLVVSVDTAVAHLAGALARPVWLLLPEPADWRWLEKGETTPWYPTMRLFRQERGGDWGPVIQRVRAALEAFVAAPRRSESTGSAPAQDPARASGGPRAPISRIVPGLPACAETRAGIVMYDPDDTPCGASIAHYGEHRWAEIALLARCIRPGSTVLEVRPGVGLHALALSRFVGADGHVILAEADLRDREMLRENLAANGVGNATVLPHGLAPGGDADRESIDALALERLDLLKIDGGVDAPAVLAGGASTLWRLRPSFVVVEADGAGFDETSERLRELGYRRWRMETPLRDPGNFNRRGDDLFGGKTAVCLVAVPEEADSALALSGCFELP